MRKTIVFISLCLTTLAGLQAQVSFTEAYGKYRPYHYQTPQAWNRVRLEVSDPDATIWPLVEREKRFMYLTGTWKGLIPAPDRNNTHYFKNLDDVGDMYNLIMNPQASGYLIYPIWMEEQVGFSQNKNHVDRVITRGILNTLVTDLIYNVEDHLEAIVYPVDSVEQQSVEPEVYGDNTYTQDILSTANNNLYNVKNYYCYFDNRPDSVRNRMQYTLTATKKFDAEVDALAARLQKSDPSYVLIPYWMTDVYQCLPERVSEGIHRFGYIGYVVNPLSGGMELNNNWFRPNVMDWAPYGYKPYDLVAYLGSSHSIDLFLANEEARLQFIYTVFDPTVGLINRNGFDHKPAGLNLYLPEYNFEHKRNLTQFVKSLSLIIDSLTTDSTKRYADLDLSLTFSRQAATQQAHFIAGLQCFVDTVYFADFDEHGLALKVLSSDGSIDTTSVVSRLINPFYLFRIPYQSIKPGINDADLLQLADCDYATGEWGLFFFIDVLLVIALLLCFALQYISPLFYRFREEYPTALVMIIITLVMEIGVFFFFTIEALSPQVIFFDLSHDGGMYLWLIGLPVLPVLCYLLFRYLFQEKQMP